MRIRAAAFVTALFLTVVPVLANVCELNCEMAPSPAAAPSCHEQGPPGGPAGGSHTPQTCTHDHDTIRTALKTPVVTTDAMGASAIQARVHDVTVPLAPFALRSWQLAHARGFDHSPLIPLRI